MTQNTLGDLQNHLFMQLERLNEEDLEDEKLERELKRTQAVASMANQIISNATLVLKAEEMRNNSMDANAIVPRMLEG